MNLISIGIAVAGLLDGLITDGISLDSYTIIYEEYILYSFYDIIYCSLYPIHDLKSDHYDYISDKVEFFIRDFNLKLNELDYKPER